MISSPFSCVIYFLPRKKAPPFMVGMVQMEIIIPYRGWSSKPPFSNGVYLPWED